MDVLILRFDAPLMSFGAPIVDQKGEIQPYPALSMMTGLLGNALGFDHSEFGRLERLQERLRYASRQDRRGRQIQDYQTVDLSKPYMDDDRAWTTYGHLESRAGGSASDGTHIRYRDYWADAVHTVAVTLESPDESPRLDDLEAAVQHPARPLFLGRKPCLPAESLFVERTQVDTLPDALVRAPLHNRADDGPTFSAWWPTHPDADGPSDEGPLDEDMREPVTDRRDWRNQIHVGERWIVNGTVRPQT
ncbi:MAG: type I-E CRISPR-associated protein Cas5/CasD [Salinibacter sp.]|uniref:type I-E CRISPR-associated protein Cas5/CasD n=1 Tax=Salinibacter sp. TaxID=2065818 RepID=UPI0035D443EF